MSTVAASVRRVSPRLWSVVGVAAVAGALGGALGTGDFVVGFAVVAAATQGLISLASP
jgi:hypothetical protein